MQSSHISGRPRATVLLLLLLLLVLCLCDSSGRTGLTASRIIKAGKEVVPLACKIRSFSHQRPRLETREERQLQEHSPQSSMLTGRPCRYP